MFCSGNEQFTAGDNPVEKAFSFMHTHIVSYYSNFQCNYSEMIATHMYLPPKTGSIILLLSLHMQHAQVMYKINVLCWTNRSSVHYVDKENDKRTSTHIDNS